MARPECQQPLTLCLALVCSLAGNVLCGLTYDEDGDLEGTYTAEGIIMLCDALKVNATLASLECAARPPRPAKFRKCQQPLTPADTLP